MKLMDNRRKTRKIARFGSVAFPIFIRSFLLEATKFHQTLCAYIYVVIENKITACMSIYNHTVSIVLRDRRNFGIRESNNPPFIFMSHGH